jgi:hypothetical protein
VSVNKYIPAFRRSRPSVSTSRGCRERAPNRATASVIRIDTSYVYLICTVCILQGGVCILQGGVCLPRAFPTVRILQPVSYRETLARSPASDSAACKASPAPPPVPVTALTAQGCTAGHGVGVNKLTVLNEELPKRSKSLAFISPANKPSGKNGCRDRFQTPLPCEPYNTYTV